MRCIIVDDELIARKSLEHLCKKIHFLEIVRSCENGNEALAALNELQPDLVFLDMEMPGVTGLEFLASAPVLPQVIFYTSNKDYALQAFDYDVTDFLQKPTTFPRFKKAVDKAHSKHLSEIESVSTASSNKDIYIREDGKLCRLNQDDIIYFENLGDYIRIKTTNATHLIHGTLRKLLVKLNNPQFMKVHRSFIINLNKIDNIVDHSLLIDKKVIPISRVNKPLLLNQLNLI